MIPSPDDSALLANYLATHDPQLREAIIIRYVNLIHFVLGRLGISQATSVDYEDFVNQGVLGLIEAVDRYDPAHGTQFSTYATVRVRGHILDYLRSSDWMPRTARRRTRAVQEATQTLWGELGRAPTDNELAGHLQLDLPTLQQTLADAGRVIFSMDALSSADSEDDLSLHDVLADENQPDPSEQLEEGDLKSRMMSVLRQLTERERQILSLYYYEELTLKEIGEVLGVTESRVSQLHTRTVMNLKALLTQEHTAAPDPVSKRTNRPTNRYSTSSRARTHAHPG
ncbi:MAG: FliA/WhiG family RNA polymerase sigma factor [Anaerolineales bacterium]|nr:FliA/WhiG family RNA polymerase sigma factor [Anaerolineales bacterium]